MKITEIKLIGQATADDIAKWKKENPLGIYQIATCGHVGYFKNPSIADVNCAMSKVTGDAPLDLYMEFGQLTFIGGSKEILSNDTMFLAASYKLKKKADGEVAELLDL